MGKKVKVQSRKQKKARPARERFARMIQHEIKDTKMPDGRAGKVMISKLTLDSSRSFISDLGLLMDPDEIISSGPHSGKTIQRKFEDDLVDEMLAFMMNTVTTIYQEELPKEEKKK